MPKLYRIAAYTYLAYLFLAIAIVSPALTLLPERLAGDYIDRPLTLDWAWFNPFTLSLEVRGLELTEKNGEPFTGLGAASANLSLASIWSEGIVLDALRLKDFHLHVEQIAQGTFNFSDLLPPPAEPDADAGDPAGIPAITIEEVDLHASVLALRDATRATPLHSEWRDLRITAQHLSTVHEDGKPYAIALTGPAGGTLDWQGDISVPRSASTGRLQVKGLQLHGLWQYAEPWLNFRLEEGSLDVAASYSVNWSEDFAYSVSDASLALAAIDIQPKDSAALPDTAVQLGAFSLAGVSVDSASRLVTVGEITTDRLAIQGFNDDTGVSLQTLFTPHLPESEPASADEDNAEAPPAAEEAQWRARVGGFALTDSSVRWRSPFTEPALTTVTPINLRVGNVAWPFEGDTPVALDLAVNERATLSVAGDIDLGTGNGNFTYDLQDLQLPWFNPALPERVTAQLGSGALAVDGSATLREFGPDTVALNTSITDFALVHDGAEREFGSFKAITLDQLAVNIPGQQVRLEKFLLDTFSGRLHIERDGTINTSHLLAPAPDEAADAGMAGEDGEAAAGEEEPAGATPDEPPADSAPWQVAIREIAVRDTRVDFADESLSSAFRTDIESLDGSIVGLDSESAEPARVHLEGSVEGYAPVSLTGTANPLAVPPQLDLELTFDGLDMARFTPYSGTYAGYKIDRGLLTIKLDYDLADNRLNGRNEIVVNKLKLGDAVESEKALDLPLKAALALLTDANGVINLAVPVAGNLDDPQFKIGSVVAKAFMQVITKAVTAPFSLLANLVGSDDDFQHIVFASGSADLDEHNREKLSGLAAALAQRPRLTLSLAGQIHPEADRKALRQAALDAELLDGGLTRADIEGHTPAWEEAIGRRYARLDAPQEGLTAVEQQRAVRSALPLPEEQLTALAAGRETAVQEFLVGTAGMAAERVAVEPSRLDKKAPPISGVQLFIGD